MTAATRAGWLFAGLGGGGGAGASGVALTPAGRVAMVTGDAAVRQSIAMLLSTTPGERVMRPDYGCPLDRLMFAPNDATTAGLAIHYVRQAIARFEPRVEIVALDAEAAQEDAARLTVTLVYRVKATDRSATMRLEIDLDGGAAA